MSMKAREQVPLPDEVAEILAVTSCESEAELLSRIFQGANWRLRIAYGIREALSLMAVRRFSLIIADERVDDGTWMSLLCDRYDESEWTPVIVASFDADERLWQEALAHGCFDVLSKPFDEWNVLWASFNAWLGWKNQFAIEAELCMSGGLVGSN